MAMHDSPVKNAPDAVESHVPTNLPIEQFRGIISPSVRRIKVISSQFSLVHRIFFFFGVFLIAYVYGLDGMIRYTYQWKGDWGFDPDIQKQVQNAMPPYLLGYERNTLDPWRIADVPGTFGNNEFLLDGTIPNALSKYSNLQRDLIAYIRNQLAANIYPSDLGLQDIARLIAYGNNDRLDQTYADDPAWLEMIKRETGLEHKPEHECTAQQLFAPSEP